jgi:hypothetical protein
MEKQYRVVGWLAITSAIMMLPMVVLGIALEIPNPFVLLLLFIYVPLVFLSVGFSLYALYRFRRLLNDHYQFHEVDHLITAIIFGTIGLFLVALTAKLVTVVGKSGFGMSPQALLPVGIVGLVLIVMIGIPLAVLGMIFAVKLLNLQGDLWGMLRPFAFTTMAACVLYATILLAPLGGLVDAVATVMLGVVFLRAAKGPPRGRLRLSGLRCGPAPGRGPRCAAPSRCRSRSGNRSGSTPRPPRSGRPASRRRWRRSARR